MAYQGYALGLGRDAVESLSALVLKGFAPDLTIMLDLPVDTGLARAAERADGEDRYERLGRLFHERLRQAFLDIAKRAPERCVVIDAGGDLNSVEAAVRATVAERLDVEFP
jgi:dTMP kinase